MGTAVHNIPASLETEEKIIKTVEALAKELEEQAPTHTLLIQRGDKSAFNPIEPITPKKGARLVSNIIADQRK